MYKTIVEDRDICDLYTRLVTFCEVNINTDKGVFVFRFKEDRRKYNVFDPNSNMTKQYIVELVPPTNVNLVYLDNSLKDKIVIIVKIMLPKTNITILTEALYEKYVATMVKYINSKK